MRVAIAGDVAMNACLAKLGHRWLDTREHWGLNALRDIFSSVSCGVVNFEACISEDEQPPWSSDPRKILIRADPAVVPVLRELGIGAASLANNHAFDYGPATSEILKAEGIACFGGGLNARDAAQPHVREVDGTRVAFVGWVDRETIAGVWAGPAAAGANASSPDSLIEAVRSLSAETDRIVVIPHWGRDYFRYPSPAMRQLARDLIDAGAHAIVGSHSHIVGCFERYRGRPILYSSGSLLMDDVYSANEFANAIHPPLVSVVAELDLSEEPIGFNLQTFRCFKGRFQKLRAEHGQAILERNNRFLEGRDYATRYSRYETRMNRWEKRVWVDLCGRPGPTLRRWSRKLLSKAF